MHSTVICMKIKQRTTHCVVPPPAFKSRNLKLMVSTDKVNEKIIAYLDPVLFYIRMQWCRGEKWWHHTWFLLLLLVFQNICPSPLQFALCNFFALVKVHPEARPDWLKYIVIHEELQKPNGNCGRGERYISGLPDWFLLKLAVNARFSAVALF